jgi:uncharacterized protein (TIGR00251 family)
MGQVDEWLKTLDGRVLLTVLARPGTSRPGIVRVDARGLVVALRSPPEKGRANRELKDLIAELAGLRSSAVTIVRGVASRTKLIEVSTEDPQGVAARLNSAISRA